MEEKGGEEREGIAGKERTEGRVGRGEEGRKG